MDYLNTNIAKNLRRIRQSRQLSLDKLANETGISKSMLGQIERGEANPTITTIGKLISGLRVDFMDLIGTPPEKNFIIRRGTLSPTKFVQGAYKNYVYFPYGDDHPFEIYNIEIEPRSSYSCSSHGENTCEYLLVLDGTLRLESDNDEYILERGDAIKFNTDCAHTYYNDSDIKLHMCIVFTWQ